MRKRENELVLKMEWYKERHKLEYFIMPHMKLLDDTSLAKPNNATRTCIQTRF